MRSLRSFLPATRGRRILLGTVVALLLIVYAVSFLLDEPLRRRLEAQLNANLVGYGAPIRAEHAVPSQPGLPDEDVAALAAYAEDQPHVLISPYPDLEDPVVASAWDAQLRLDEIADPRLQEFTDRYAGNGPERGATRDSGVEETVG